MTDPDTIREGLRFFSFPRDEANAALDRLVDDIDSLRLELEAERHTHRKDNEHLLARLRTLEAALREIRRTATNIGDHHVPDLLARLDAIETIAALAAAETTERQTLSEWADRIAKP